MSNHSLTTFRANQEWNCWCECTSRSPGFQHRWEAEDWGIAHLHDVERVRIHLGNRNPSLVDQRNWYRDRAKNDPNPAYRKLWEQLAEGLDHRIGQPPDDQPLFEEAP